MTNLLVQGLEMPHALALFIDFIPPTKSDQDPTTHILDSPEIQRYQKYRDNELDHEALNEYGAENVKRQGRELPSMYKAHMVKITTVIIVKVNVPHRTVFLNDAIMYLQEPYSSLRVHTLNNTVNKHTPGCAYCSSA